VSAALRTVGAAAVLALAVAAPVALTATASERSSTCQLAMPSSGVSDVEPEAALAGQLDAAQVANARIVVGVGQELGVPDRAEVIALATALQESSLRNLSGGDRDSAGLFQQRPSAGWGSYAQVTDAVFASATFYSRLAKVPQWQRLPLAQAAQSVQLSAYANAYGRWEPVATSLQHALSQGSSSLADCMEGEGPSADPSTQQEAMGPDGLTATTRYVRDLVVDAFDVHDIGGYCPGGCTNGHVSNSDHYTGRAIDVMLTPMDDAHHRTGNAIASWAAANASRLNIKYVIWDRHIWSESRADEGWRPYRHPSGRSSATLDHEDHVHISTF
jgi:hypothetical protein